jgi:hypothetical protein
MMNTEDTVIERQSSKFDYKVEQVRLLTPEGQETRFFGNRRIDTQEVFASVTDQYEIVQNDVLFSTAEKLFGQKSMTGYKRKIVVTNGGARARAIYDFPNIGAKIGNQDVTFRLKVQNSFDGSLRASFQVGLVRLICSNGLAVPVNTLNVTKKHTSNIQEEFVGRALDSAINSFHNALPAFEQMARISVSPKDGENIMLNFVKAKDISERMATEVLKIWTNPTYHEDRERNLWNLYNATTQHLTHEVEGKRFELAEKVNTRIMSAFVKSARNNSLSPLLVSLN